MSLTGLAYSRAQLADPGYWINENGLIEQWGTVQSSAIDGQWTATYPIAFTTLLNIFAFPKGGGIGASNVRVASITVRGNTQTTGYVADLTGTGVLNDVYWRALGI